MARPIAQIRDELRVAEGTAHALRDELHAALIEQSGVAVGDVVKVTIRQHRGSHLAAERLDALVTHIEPRHGAADRPWIRGRVRRKDGEWSKQIRHFLGEWEPIA